MSPNATYAAASVWNRYFASLAARGDDLNAPGWWSPAFLPTLEQHQVTSALDLGCGTGSDTLVLARAGFRVTGLGYSAVALERAEAKAQANSLSIEFQLGDMARLLPFPAASFDAVMSNVALHSFPDRETRTILAEIHRVVRPGGLLLLHLNAIDDMPYRARLCTCSSNR